MRLFPARIIRPTKLALHKAPGAAVGYCVHREQESILKRREDAPPGLL